MHHDQRQRAAIFLPVTMAEDWNTGFHFDQTLFGSRQVDSTREKKGRESLDVPTPQPSMRTENRGHERQRFLCQAGFEPSS